MTRLVVLVLGRQEVWQGRAAALDVPDIYWPVLGCLLSVPGNRSNRGRLAAQIWPDQDEASARHCLATALWRIRSRLPGGEDQIRATLDGVVLNPAARVWIDATAFERRARCAVADPARLEDRQARRRLARALAHYKGDFLPDRTEEAVEIERARLRALYLDAMYELAMAEARAGEWAQARVTARTLCEAEPLREDAQRLLIEAFFRLGNRALALRQFETCARILERELSVPPMSETLALAAMIRAHDAPPASLPAVPAGGAATGGARERPSPPRLGLPRRRAAAPPAPDAGAGRSAVTRAALLRARRHLLRTLSLIEESLAD